MDASQLSTTPPNSPTKLLCVEPKKPESSKRKWGLPQTERDNWVSTMQRAKDVQANLAPEFPSFIKTMLHSHVVNGFSVSLVRKFCNLHLPKEDSTIVLESEDGKLYENKYFANRGVLSAGWRVLAMDHKLVEGDVLVFQLVSPRKFKIYIIRSRPTDDAECAIGLIKFETHDSQGGDTVGNIDDDSQKNGFSISYQSDRDSNDIVPEKMIPPKKLKKSKSNVLKKCSEQSLCKTASPTIERAKEVQSNLGDEFPSFVKYMVQSNVTRCFCLSLPKKFCNLHLPNHDATIALEDENGVVSETKFLLGKGGLSAGWRRFSIDHKLNEGDVLIFQLVSSFKFKIYVIRSNGSDKVGCAQGLLDQVDNVDVIPFEDGAVNVKPLRIVKSDGDEVDDNQKMSYQSDKDSDDMSPEILDGIKLSDSVVAFEEMRSIEDFKVLVNGLVINSELSKYLLGKYYELCSSQKMFLHKNLLEGLNCKLIAGIISETINIADAIQASKITSSVSDFSIWEKTLLAFEGLGMNVGFLRSRLDKLVILAVKSKEFENVTKLDTLGSDHHELEIMFEEVACAPW